MSTTAQNYEFVSGNVANEAKDQSSLNNSGEPADPSNAANPSGILGAASGAVGNISQAATNAVKQGADAVVNAGKGVLEMGGSVISGLKRGFSKTSESGND